MTLNYKLLRIFFDEYLKLKVYDFKFYVRKEQVKLYITLLALCKKKSSFHVDLLTNCVFFVLSETFFYYNCNSEIRFVQR